MKHTSIALPVTLALGVILLVGCGAQVPTPDSTGSSGETASIEEYTGARVPNGSYTVDVEQSELLWSADRVLSKGHEGSVRFGMGTVEVSDDNFSGIVVVDMSTLHTDDSELLIAHLKSADFFDVKEYPKSTFALKNIEYRGEEVYVAGDITILGETREVIFPVVVTETADAYKVASVFMIDRTLWGVTYGSNSFFDNLGDKAISNDITFDLSLFLRLAEGDKPDGTTVDKE